MELEQFIQVYQNRLDLSSISWEDFPTELQGVGISFMNNWKDELSIRVLRELSGFDDMSVKDLLAYANDRDVSEEEDS